MSQRPIGLRTAFLVAGLACSGFGCGASADDDEGTSADARTSAQLDAASSTPTDATPAAPRVFPELWYSVDTRLMRIVLDDTGGAASLTESALAGLGVGHNSLTMLDDGSLMGARLSNVDSLTHFFHIAEPPRDGSDADVVLLGVMPESLMLEGLYTDCDGRLYGMDTGADASSSTGNRLIRFTGDYLQGDFAYDVVSDLSSADVADIDDMGPAIVNNEIVDNPGLAIDSGLVYGFNYETGTGSVVGSGGTWGIHALGAELFTDSVARLYVLSQQAELLEMDPGDFSVSPVLITGPSDVEGFPGWSGLTGPLTECDSGFEVD